MKNLSNFEAIKDLVDFGFYIFPLVPNDKKPPFKGGFKNATLDLDQIDRWNHKYKNANWAIRTGKVSNLVVLDIDIKNDIDGAKSLQKLIKRHGEIPETLTIQTPSGGFHHYFRAPETEIRCSTGSLGEGIDIRGEDGYIVSPPSEINGTPYQKMSATSEIAPLPKWIEELLTKKPKPSGKSKHRIDSPGTQEGRRNNHIFKEASRLRNEGVSPEDAEWIILKEAANCEPPLPDEEALKTLSGAYERYAEGETVPEEIKKINRDHFVAFVGAKYFVCKETKDPVMGFKYLQRQKPSDFSAFHNNQYLQIENKRVSLGSYWLTHPKRRQYQGVYFEPFRDIEGYYNQWRGFDVTPREGDCGLYLNHIKEVIADNDESIYEYFICWMANLIQNPGNRPGVSLVLKGKQGAGKGVVVRELGEIFGSHFRHISSTDHLTGRFNAHLDGAVLVFADEAFWAGDKAAEGRLKALITEKHMTIERKGVDAEQVKNHIHLIVASNEDWVVPAGPEERRFCVVDVSDRRIGDREYFSKLTHQMNNGGREALLHYLMNYDISDCNLNDFPKTKALLESKIHSMHTVDKFWLETLEEGTLGVKKGDWNDGKISTDLFYLRFNSFCKGNSNKYKLTKEELGTKIRKFLPKGYELKSRPMSGGTRRAIYTFPPLAECREYFDKFFDFKFNWTKD